MQHGFSSTYEVIGDIPPALRASWNHLIYQAGTGFQSFEWCQAFTRSWQGIFTPEHIAICVDDQVVAAIPAYQHEQCSPVDYYRRAIPTNVITDPILLSHAFAGWYGFPVAAYPDALEQLMSAFIRRAAQLGALAWFAGIDERDQKLHTLLRNRGFELRPFHTVMIRSLDAATTTHGLEMLANNRRKQIRKAIRHAEQAGTTTRLATSADNPAIMALIDCCMRQKDVLPDVISPSFVEQILAHPIPGREAIVAVNQGRVVGVNINLHWGKTYALWIGGHDRTTLNRYYQSHLLYEAGVQRAIELGCHEIQAGRSPYPIKIWHGYHPIRVCCAVRGSTEKQHDQATKWIEALERRHSGLYPEVA